MAEKSNLTRLHKALAQIATLEAKIISLDKQLEQQGDENRVLVRMCNNLSQELGSLKLHMRKVGEINQ